MYSFIAHHSLPRQARTVKPFHLNLGLRLLKPYESTYAMMRRFYTVNIGIPTSACEAMLHDKSPLVFGIIQRVYQLHPNHYRQQITRIIPDYEVIHRHCPQCAKNLYHSDIYCFSWLTRCPIHHCRFVERCPVCTQEWPAVKEIIHRDCPGCGCLLVKDNPLEGEEDIKRNYQCIGEVYKLIDYDSLYVEYLIGNDVRHPDIERHDWYTQIGPQHQMLPSCQSQLNPDFTPAKLDTLHIKTAPVKIKSFDLQPYPGSWYDVPYDNKRFTRSIDLQDNQKSILLSDYSVMRRILLLFNHHINKNHQLHITSYRYISHEHLLQGPPPCLFCLTLSLWFYNMASQKYGWKYWMKTDEFPLTKSARPKTFFWVPDVAVLDNNYVNVESRGFHTYTISPRFTGWFYRRGLEIAFVKSFLFAQELISDLRNNQLLENRPAIIEPDQYYFFQRIKNKLIFFYEHEHPVDEITVPHVPYNAATCKKHHQYLKTIIDKTAYFDAPLPKTPLRGKDFYAIHKAFYHFLNHRKFHFTSPFSIPVHMNQAHREKFNSELNFMKKSREDYLNKAESMKERELLKLAMR